MKKLLAIFLSFNMIIAPVALAAESSSPGDQFRNGPVKGGADYLNQILGMANGIIGSQVLIHCTRGKMSPSLIAFMAGGVIYVAKEILGGKGQKAVLTASASSLKMLEEKMKNGGDTQKAALEAALTDEKEKLKFVKNRKMWMMAITAVYGVATGLAIAEELRPDQQLPALCVYKAGSDKLMAAAIAGAYSFMSGGGLMGGAASGAAAAFLPNLVSAGTAAGASVPLLNRPEGRIGWFGASTVLSGMIMMGLSKREKILKGNIEKLENAIANFKNETSGPGTPGDSNGPNGPGDAEINNPGEGPGAIAMLPDGIKNLPKNCMAKDTSTFGESSCSSPLRMSSPKLAADLSLPTLQAGSQMATDLANAVSTGNVEAANVAAGGLAAMAGRIEQAKKNLAKQLNDKLKKQGKGPLDVDALANAKLAAAQSSLGSNPGIQNAMASMSDSSSDNKLDSVLKSIPQTPKPIAASPSVSVPTADGTAITEGPMPEVGDEAGKVAEVDMNQDYEYNENDVSKKKETSIFKQVSDRYVLNYPKLFSRNEPAPEEAPKK